ncbi:MAG: class I SAM-dependent methyltransferase [Burkholderiales bacterium]
MTTHTSRFTPAPAPSGKKRSSLDQVAERWVMSHLGRIEHGEIILIDAHKRSRFGTRAAACDLSATIYVHDSRFYTELALGGSVGAGEAYMLGFWDTSDLTALVRIMIRNQAAMDGMEGGLARWGSSVRKLAHWAHRNTRRGSRHNIAAHYDLGNDFFSLFLDCSMMYSCAIFASEDTSLEDAQRARLDVIGRKLQLERKDHLIEIGSGWGALAIHAARFYGCKVTTTTISRQQYELTRARVKEAGLEHRVTVLQKDYRDLSGQFDKLVSIEMIEAVGHQYFDAYFRKCSALLKPEGLMLLQAITIADQRYEAAKRSVDFIQRHIFPGSCIPSVSELCASAARGSDMVPRNLEDIGPHYATTLRHWRGNFTRNLEQIRALGYSESFIRMWEFYLRYCEGGFEERALGDVLMLFAKPGNRSVNPMPASRLSLPQIAQLHG